MDELDLVIEAMAIVTEPLSAHTITHICYGDFHNAYPKMLDIPVDQIDLEFANSDYSLLEEFAEAPFTKYIGLGISDVHTHHLESALRRLRVFLRRLSVLGRLLAILRSGLLLAVTIAAIHRAQAAERRDRAAVLVALALLAAVPSAWRAARAEPAPSTRLEHSLRAIDTRIGPTLDWDAIGRWREDEIYYALARALHRGEDAMVTIPPRE